MKRQKNKDTKKKWTANISCTDSVNSYTFWQDELVHSLPRTISLCLTFSFRLHATTADGKFMSKLLLLNYPCQIILFQLIRKKLGIFIVQLPFDGLCIRADSRRMCVSTTLIPLFLRLQHSIRGCNRENVKILFCPTSTMNDDIVAKGNEIVYILFEAKEKQRKYIYIHRTNSENVSNFKSFQPKVLPSYAAAIIWHAFKA